MKSHIIFVNCDDLLTDHNCLKRGTTFQTFQHRKVEQFIYPYVFYSLFFLDKNIIMRTKTFVNT